VFAAAAVLAALVLAAPALSRAPTPPPAKTTRTYTFEAKVTKNGGMDPLPVGEAVTATFTYDLAGEPFEVAPKQHGGYRSNKNALAFEYGDLKFASAGVTVYAGPGLDGNNEYFDVVTTDVKLPKGWEKRGGFQRLHLVLWNAPPDKKAGRPGPPFKANLDGFKLPLALSLADWPGLAEFRLEFSTGVTFPGGAVNKPALMRAAVEKLTAARR
jgi:hypothetical protein